MAYGRREAIDEKKNVLIYIELSYLQLRTHREKTNVGGNDEYVRKSWSASVK